MNWQQLLTLDQGQKKEAHRTTFERDYDRIIFSSPFRRLQDKTQVFPLPKQDFVHSRLTHSLEVSSVGRSLGKKVGEALISKHKELQGSIQPSDFGAIVAAASLAHDIGNPPFGHSGESAISDFFQSTSLGQLLLDKVSAAERADLSSFEGNAQGFRLLTNDWYQGLKVSDACLGAFTKYPRSSSSEKIGMRKSQSKFGYYQTEAQTFRHLAERLGLKQLNENSWCRHPLAFLVEAADDICYHLIDLEDGARMGLVPHNDAVELYAGVLKDRFQPEKLKKIRSKEEQIAVLRAVAIGVLIDQVVQLFLDNEEGLLSGDFDQALTAGITADDAMKQIIKISVADIYRSSENLSLEAAGFEVLGGLIEKISQGCYNKLFDQSKVSHRHNLIFRFLPEGTRHLLGESDISVYQMLRVALDYLSSLTDSEALRLYRRLNGMA